jgi:tRNA A37 threonylcarbamoyladenosine dehydratase
MRNGSSASTDARMFSRTVDLLGEAGFARLRAARAVVVGLGGVGSHAAVALARAGIGSLRLVDFDAIGESSLNRHAIALPGDVGRPKVEVVAAFLARLRPELTVETSLSFFHRDTADDVLAGPPDVVLDAIDSLNPKVELLTACVARGIPVVTSLGASTRTDPGLVRVASLALSRGCPLGKQLRKRLRRRGVDLSMVTAVYSTERARKPLPPDPEDGWLERGLGRERHRQPSLPTLPGIFGYATANAAIALLAGSLDGGR